LPSGNTKVIVDVGIKNDRERDVQKRWGPVRSRPHEGGFQWARTFTKRFRLRSSFIIISKRILEDYKN
jgi:hypothetical protein